MPRVNRDLQRRLAARRERERRRPSGERRYRFAAPAPEPDEALVEQDGAVSAPSSSLPVAVAPATRGGVRPEPKPFTAYRDEYAYVSTDLRRVAAVIGGLLLALIILYFVLPILVH